MIKQLLYYLGMIRNNSEIQYRSSDAYIFRINCTEVLSIGSLKKLITFRSQFRINEPSFSSECLIRCIRSIRNVLEAEGVGLLDKVEVNVSGCVPAAAVHLQRFFAHRPLRSFGLSFWLKSPSYGHLTLTPRSLCPSPVILLWAIRTGWTTWQSFRLSPPEFPSSQSS